MDVCPVSRRDFLRIGSGTVAAGVAVNYTLLEPEALWGANREVSPSDRIRFASIGTGVRGCELLKGTLPIPGTECVAVCDLYDGRHVAAREALQKDVPATRNYKEILDRKDVDAVIVAVTDHQHRRVVEDACAAGKDVYCEKPLSHTVDDGYAMIAAAEKGSRILQVGSQRVSSILYAKAKEIYDSGRLGDVYSVSGYCDRNSASGAWVYPIPSSASEQTIDWTAFLDGTPKRSFDPVRFFRWRCFTDYGEGLAGDLFVHIISGMQFITGTSTIPERAMSAGGLFRWKDGREFPDLIQTLYEYPKFHFALRCSLNSEGGEFIGFYGTKGTMIIKDGALTFHPQDTRPQPEGYSTQGWPAELRNAYLAQWRTEHPSASPLEAKVNTDGESFTVPSGYSDTVDHLANFFNSVRTRKPPVQDGHFGNNASVACHMANYSYFNRTAANWDAPTRKIKS